MRILIVAWAWPPVGRVGALRPVGFAREWARLGHEIHVLTGPGDRGGEWSPDLLPLVERIPVTIHRAPAPAIPVPVHPMRDVARPGEARTVSRLRQVLGQWKGFPDLQRSWIGPAGCVAMNAHASRPFDVVFSTSPPESVHFVARRMARGGVPWVADFRARRYSDH